MEDFNNFDNFDNDEIYKDIEELKDAIIETKESINADLMQIYDNNKNINNLLNETREILTEQRNHRINIKELYNDIDIFKKKSINTSKAVKLILEVSHKNNNEILNLTSISQYLESDIDSIKKQQNVQNEILRNIERRQYSSCYNSTKRCFIKIYLQITSCLTYKINGRRSSRISPNEENVNKDKNNDNSEVELFTPVLS